MLGCASRRRRQLPLGPTSVAEPVLSGESGAPSKKWHLANMGSFGGVAQDREHLVGGRAEQGRVKSGSCEGYFTKVHERDALPRVRLQFERKPDSTSKPNTFCATSRFDMRHFIGLLSSAGEFRDMKSAHFPESGRKLRHVHDSPGLHGFAEGIVQQDRKSSSLIILLHGPTGESCKDRQLKPLGIKNQQTPRNKKDGIAGHEQLWCFA